MLEAGFGVKDKPGRGLGRQTIQGRSHKNGELNCNSEGEGTFGSGKDQRRCLEPTSVIHFLGTQGISLRVCGAENPSQGPWEPGALGAALILGGLETAGGALQLPFPSL